MSDRVCVDEGYYNRCFQVGPIRRPAVFLTTSDTELKMFRIIVLDQ